jgi:hypothetical protein
MKRFIFIALFLMCIVGTVSAYGVYLTCPATVQTGLPLQCTLGGDFPPGTAFNVVLYQSQYTATEISSQTVTMQGNGINQSAIFDTTGLPGGNYKVEAQVPGSLTPRSDSVTLQLVQVIDRSPDLTVTSSLTQNLDDALMIGGSVAKEGSAGVEIEVTGPNGRMFGPQWIGTTSDTRTGAGTFSQKVIVTSAGNYTVDFSDANGYISSVTFTVAAPETAVITAVPTTVAPVQKTMTTITVPTPWPTETKSPLSPLPVIGAVAVAGLLLGRMNRQRR